MQSTSHRFYWLNFGIPLACAAVVFLMFDMTSIDIAFSNLFFDPITQTFPIDQVHFFEKLTHKWARIIPNWTAEIALIGAILSFVWPLVTPQNIRAWATFWSGPKPPLCFGLPGTIVGIFCLWYLRSRFARE